MPCKPLALTILTGLLTASCASTPPSPSPTAPLPPPEACLAPCPPLPVRQDAGGLLSRLLPRSIDTGDLLMLLILLLLAVDGEEEDSLSVLLTAAAFLLS